MKNGMDAIYAHGSNHDRRVGTREVRAYGCIHCQQLQLAVSFSEENLQRYQQFEGEQPGVLERISSEPSRRQSD